MNPTFDDKARQELGNATETVDPSSRRPWVKPALERLSLKDALTAAAGASDGGGSS
jgi:hypothetical protein